jgi:hypothetical protein
MENVATLEERRRRYVERAEAAERAAAKHSGDHCKAYLKQAQDYRELAARLWGSLF